MTFSFCSWSGTPDTYSSSCFRGLSLDGNIMTSLDLHPAQFACVRTASSKIVFGGRINIEDSVSEFDEERQIEDEFSVSIEESDLSVKVGLSSSFCLFHAA